MASRIQVRRDTAANWTSTNPTLVQGELGLETDTGRWKVGDGTTAWTSLTYVDTTQSTWLTKRTKMPDGATAGEYLKNTFTGTDSFSAVDSGGSSIAAAGGKLVLTITGGAGTYRILKTAAHSIYFGFVALEFDTNAAVTKVEMFNSTTAWIELTTKYVGASKTRYYGLYPMPIGYTAIQFRFTVSGNTAVNISGIYYGMPNYLDGTLSEEAARFANEGGDAPGVGVAASMPILFASGSLPANGSSIVVGGKTYTFRDQAYWDLGVLAEGDVKIGVDSSATSNYFRFAINRTSPGSYDGVYYKVAAEHPLVSAVWDSVRTVTVTAKTAGILGNQIAIAASSSPAANVTLSGSTLSEGYGAGAAKMSYMVARASQGLDAKTSIVDADEVLILDSAGGKVKKRLTWANLKSILLAADGGTTAGTAVQGNDSRLAVKGTWTPVLLGATTAGSNTYSAQTGHYTRIGDHVFLTGVLTLSAKDVAMAGNAYIGGFPFNIGSGMGGGFSIGRHAGFNFSGVSGGSLGASLDTGTNRAQLVISPNNGGTTQAIAPANVADTATIYFSLHYCRA